MIVVIMQCITLTGRLLASKKRHFIENGGKKEEMYRERKKYRDNSDHIYHAHDPEVEYGTSQELPF